MPEEAVEVVPGTTHHYPYHEIDAAFQRYPGERLYLAAKADYEAREFLSKAALYAAAKARSVEGEERRKFEALAAVILLKFAQVIPTTPLISISRGPSTFRRRPSPLPIDASIRPPSGIGRAASTSP